MNIYWERNSKVKNLLSQGKITDKDVIQKTTTDDFPTEAATVRIQRIQDKTPTVTVHIRGKSRGRKMWNGNTYEGANTCRVNISNEWKTGTMSSNGDLDEYYDWQDVHNVITKVRETLGL